MPAELQTSDTQISIAAPASRLARSASILGLGNVASRVMGLARDVVTSYFFGSSGQLSAFIIASNVPSMIFDLLIGGMLSAAVVPVLSAHSRRENRAEFVGIASAMLTLIACFMGFLVLVLELFTRPIAGLLGNFSDPTLQEVLVNSLRVVAPALLCLGLAGGVTGLLYSLERFSYTALSGAMFNTGIVVATLLLSHWIGIYALAVGVVAGSVMQLAVLIPGLYDLRLRLSAGWSHPAIRRIVRLYLPIALGVIVAQFQIVMDRRWASAAGAQSVSWMKYATTLIQMPLGLVAVAVSLAALPSLSQRSVAGDLPGFRSILGRGLRLVLVLLIPATVGLWVLAEPVIGILFEHGSFGPADTAVTAQALHLYLLGLLFAGISFPLSYAFFSRQDTRTPATVSVIAIGCYFLVAISLKGPLGFLGLVLADSAKQAGQAVILFVLLGRAIGRFRQEALVQTVVKAGGSAILMGLVVKSLALWLPAYLPKGWLGDLGVVIISGALGSLIYLGTLRFLRMPEAIELADAFVRHLNPIPFR